MTDAVRKSRFGEKPTKGETVENIVADVADLQKSDAELRAENAELRKMQAVTSVQVLALTECVAALQAEMREARRAKLRRSETMDGDRPPAAGNWMTVREICKRARHSKSAVHKWIDRELVRAHPGPPIKIDWDTIPARFLTRCTECTIDTPRPTPS
jgi:hypothetical protein